MPRPLDLGEHQRELTALLRRQAGLARRSQLRELGIGKDHVAARVAAGRWRLVAPEVVSADNGRLDAEQLRWRAVLHAPGAAWLSHLTALEDLGLTGWGDDDVHLLVPRQSRPSSLPRVVLHQTERLPHGHPELTLGLPVVPAPRAALLAASRLPHPRLAAALVIAVLRQRLAAPGPMLDELEQSGRVRHKLAVADAIRAAAEGSESLAEADVVVLARRAGLPEPRRQVRSGGKRVDLEVDLPDGRVLVLEIDGPQHSEPRARWADAQRDAALAAEGKLLLRIPAYAVRTEPGRIVADLRRILVAARARAG